MSASRWVYLTGCSVLDETDKAFLLDVPQGDDFEKHWMPKSQMADPDDLEVGDVNITVGVTPFIAQEKELETDDD